MTRHTLPGWAHCLVRGGAAGARAAIEALDPELQEHAAPRVLDALYDTERSLRRALVPGSLEADWQLSAESLGAARTAILCAATPEERRHAADRLAQVAQALVTCAAVMT